MTIRTGLGAVMLAAVLAMAGAAPLCAQEQILNLRDADIRAFIDDVAMMTGRTFIVDPRVTGRVTVTSSTPVSESELMDIFSATLSVHGFAAVPTGSGAMKIIPDEVAAQQPGPVGGEGVTGGQFVTEVIRLHRIDPAPVLNMVRPLVHRQGQIAANRGGNAIIVVDTADNIARVRAVIRDLDRDTSVTKAVQLVNSSAREMAGILRSVAGRTDGEMPRQAIDIVPVARGNTLLIRGDADSVNRLTEMARELDSNEQRRNDLRVIPLRHADAEQLLPILEKVSAQGSASAEGGAATGGANIAFDKGTNALIISADASTQATLAAVVEQLDVRRAQVLVEAIIVEVSDRAARELGLQWVLSGKEGSSIPFTVANYSNTAPNVLAAAGAIAADEATDGDSSIVDDLQQTAINSFLGLDGFAAGIAGESGDAIFGVILNALKSDVSSNLLSTPSILTMNNEEAHFLVGQEIPITTGEALGTDNTNAFRTIDRQDVGVQLDVRPQITDGDTVKLFIRQEVSSIAGPVTANSTELVTDKRELGTTVLVDDGEIIVLGGLIENDERISIDKVPLLGDIPVLGHAFRSEAKSRTRTNLMVFLRPTIVRDADDMRTATEVKYNYIRAEQLLRDGNATNLDSFMDQVLGASPAVGGGNE